MGSSARCLVSLVCISVLISVACSLVDSRLKYQDFDELRVSNNQPHLNYQRITPDDDQPTSQMTNYFGKPLLQSIEAQSNMGKQMYQQQQSRGLRPQWIRMAPKKSDGPIRAMPTKMGQEETCKWMSLDMFKQKSLKPSELIIRDDEDQLCYVLVMTAYIKSSEDNYFLLSNLKTLPYANKVKFDSQTGDGLTNAVHRHSPLNCSAMANGIGITGPTGLFLPIQRSSNRSFREEITIAADCGYLVLNTHVDGLFLTLESISFYQNPDGSSQLPITEFRKGAGQNRTEDLIFTTDGTSNSPLFTMPSVSQYICRNRIRLAGNNSVQLIFDRFELMRLVPYTFTKEHVNSPAQSHRQRKLDDTDDDHSAINGRFVARSRRSSQTIHATQHNQPYASALRNTGLTVTRCPNSAHPSEPLTAMVEVKKEDHTSGRQAERRMSVNSASKNLPTGSCMILSIFGFILTLWHLRQQSAIGLVV